jgi:hypothetical protein
MQYIPNGYGPYAGRGRRPSYWFLALLVAAFLLVLGVSAWAARCAYPHEYYRPSLGVCELKAGGAHWRHAAKAVKVRAKPVHVRRARKPGPAETLLEPAVPLPRPSPVQRTEPTLIDRRWW